MDYRYRPLKREEFDPDLSPDSPHNREIAERLDLTYDSKRRLYLDSNGYPARDQFGQELG